MNSTSPSNLAPLSGPTGRVVAAHRHELRDVLQRHGMTNAQLFGSVARGEDQPGSDVDILVDFPAGTSLFTILRVQDELEEILGVAVDLISRSGLKSRVRTRVQQDLIAL